MSQSVQLVRPDVTFKERYLEALAEFQQEGLAWVMDIDIESLRRDFDQFVKLELVKKTFWTKDTPVDETELWAIVDGIYVGRLSIRHRLNEDLKTMGGHIGYDTRPSFRGRGIASWSATSAADSKRDRHYRRFAHLQRQQSAFDSRY